MHQERASELSIVRLLQGFAVLVVLLAGATQLSAVCCKCSNCVGGSGTCLDDITGSECAAICDSFSCGNAVYNSGSETCANNCGVPTPTPTPDPKVRKCVAAKLKIAGKYAYCRQKAQRKAETTGDPADYDRCVDRFQDQWSAAELAGAGLCPATGDAPAIEAFIADHTDAVGAAVRNGTAPTCP